MERDDSGQPEFRTCRQVRALARSDSDRHKWQAEAQQCVPMDDPPEPGWQGPLDHYLAMTGYDAQQTDEPTEESPGNLLSPLPGDPGADGRFDRRSHWRSLQSGMARHPNRF